MQQLQQLKKDGLLYDCSWSIERWSGSAEVRGWPETAEVNGNLYFTIWADDYDMYGNVTSNEYYGFASGPYTSIGAKVSSSFHNGNLGLFSYNTDKTQLP